MDLRFDVEGCAALDPAVKERLKSRCRRRLDADGFLVVVSQITRDRGRNLEEARDRLAALIRAALVEPKSRRPTRPTRASRERRLAEKKLTSQRKKRRTECDFE